MSKQSEAKEKQCYVAKAIPQTCGNCMHFQSDMVEMQSGWMGTTWMAEKNLRCGIGGFSVKKMGTCKEFIARAKKE